MNKTRLLIAATIYVGITAISSLDAELIAPSADEPIKPAGQATPVSCVGNFAGLTLSPDLLSSSNDELGYGFGKGVTEVGLSLGVGLGSTVFGSTDAHDFMLTKLYFGYIISDVIAKDHWYRGHWEVAGEVFGGEQFKPKNAYLVGATPVLRYNFASGRRWVPFLDIGAGGTTTDIGRPDLGGSFQFNLQTGAGLRWFLCKDTVLTLQYRFLHLSNAGMENPNHGVNASVLYAGVGWLF
jgi:hypothetical protein